MQQVAFTRRTRHPATSRVTSHHQLQTSRGGRTGKATSVDSFYTRARRIVIFGFVVVIVAVVGTLGYLGVKSFQAASTIIVSNKRSGDLPIVGSAHVDSLPIINWEQKKERINILVLGLDRRYWEKPESTRTDTIILVSINPEDKSVVMYSIPRDLEVPMEYHGSTRYVKINSVHVWGAEEGDRGSGPAAVKKVVSEILGVPVHYFVRIDFDGFRRVIDELGGVTIDVDIPLYDYEYPDEEFGYDPVEIDAGIQVMDGDTALKYARSRHANDWRQASDLSRAERQQQVAVAVKEKAIASRWDLITDPVKLANLLDTMKENVLTDISLEEIIELMKLGREIDTSNPRSVASRVMGTPHIYHKEVEGKDWRFYASDPTFGEIKMYIAELFDNPYLLEDIESEGAVIRFENGTTYANFAAAIASDLQQEYGLILEKSKSADRNDYAVTAIHVINAGSYPETVSFLERYFNSSSYVPNELQPGETADIIVILGEDMAETYY